MSGTDDNKPPRPPQASDEQATKNVFEESKKDVTGVATEILNGEWGDSSVVRGKLIKAGYDPREVRAEMVRLSNL